MYETINKLQEDIKGLEKRKGDVYQMIVKERKANGHSTVLDGVYLELDRALIEKQAQRQEEYSKVEYKMDTVDLLNNRLQLIEKNKGIYPVVDNLINELDKVKALAFKVAKDIETFSNKSGQDFNFYVRDIKYVADTSINGLITIMKRIPEYDRDTKGIEQKIKDENKKREDIKRAAEEEKNIKESLMKY